MSLISSPYDMLNDDDVDSPENNIRDSFRAIVEIESGEIRSDAMESPKQMTYMEAYIEAYRYLQKMSENRRRPDKYLDAMGRACVRDLQIKQLCGSFRTGFVVLMALQNRNKANTDPDRKFSVPAPVESSNLIHTVRATLGAGGLCGVGA